MREVMLQIYFQQVRLMSEIAALAQGIDFDSNCPRSGPIPSADKMDAAKLRP